MHTKVEVVRVVKGALLKTLLAPGFPAALKHVQRHCATIFMLHRFQDPERGVAGCDSAYLRRVLTYLRRNGYELIGLDELFNRLAGRGPQPRGAVAFTIDDGYLEQATVAAPVFAEFGCPVTTFVATGFLDRVLWFWWDRIEYVFQRTATQRLRQELGGDRLEYAWTDEDERIQAQLDFTERCKLVPEREKNDAIERLARVAGVELPERPPAQYQPMTWDQLRDCERMGMRFGPHTATHPILSRTTDEQSRAEIVESWSRLCAEARRPVPVFCYPNGGWNDFGPRETGVLDQLGLHGAVVGEPGYANAMTFQRDRDARFKVLRFGLPDGLPHAIQYVSGVERFKQILRGRE
jgi:peptidoglycan/xylan/chitin deacetylase (PgdA/CDA1 family)